MRRPVLSRYLDASLLNRLAQLKFEPRSLVEGNLAGAHKSALSGFAVEFSGHREYVPGDDPRHIDWRVYYHREKYFLKQYEMETNLVCHLVMDISASMRYGEGRQQKLLAAANLTAVLAHSILRQNDKVSLTTIDETVREHLPPSDSFAQVVRLTELLDDVGAENKTQLGASLGELAARFGRREIVVVISDFLCDLELLSDAVQRLRYRAHEVVFFHVMHHDELTLELNGLTRFEGLEEQDLVVADPYELRTHYLEAVREFCGQVRDLVESANGEYLVFDTSRDFAELLADYLQRRAR